MLLISVVEGKGFKETTPVELKSNTLKDGESDRMKDLSLPSSLLTGRCSPSPPFSSAGEAKCANRSGSALQL